MAADKLQWGHRLSAMEIARRHHAPGDLRVASMGPPPFGDGKITVGWPGVPFEDTLQWGHRLSAMERPRSTRWPTYGATSFNGATAFRRWRSRRRNKPPPCWLRFNGATAFRRWKASPWSAIAATVPSFNEATAFRRWKATSPPPTPSTPSRFNEATAFRRWKGPICDGDHPPALHASMRPPPFGDGKGYLRTSFVDS